VYTLYFLTNKIMRLSPVLIKLIRVAGICVVFVFGAAPCVLPADKPFENQIKTLIGPNDSAILADPDGNIVFSANENTARVPASTLKMLTALTAMSILGQDFKFVTRFYLDPHQNLIIKGFGDPVLVSESIKEISRHLSNCIKKCNALVLDDHYFEKPLTIPGITDSLEPYDAPNGALCVNFNTVYFKRGQNMDYVSAEPQTPLLPFVIDRIRSSGLNEGRILLSAQGDECTRYAGHLFLYFLKESGTKTNNEIRMGKVDENQDRLIYTHASEADLKTIIQRMLEFSSNYIANQLLIAASAKAYGEPGSLGKGVTVMKRFISQHIADSDATVVEGSGISRQNRVTAKTMLKILLLFRPYYDLMRQEGPVYYKTGTLSDVRARVGYIRDNENKLHPFVILLNTPGKTDSLILNGMIAHVQPQTP
jgi:serine-type D-Ala-D-Ala carboxypeptidase/endopeptidase (penicillin-binding protein 4)